MNNFILTLSSVAAIAFSGLVGYSAISEVVDVYHPDNGTTVVVYYNPMAN